MISAFKALGLLFALLLIGCGEDADDRVVETLISPAGHKVHFMAVTDKDVTDVSIRFAWATNWTLRDDSNPALPHVASRLISSGGTAGPNPQEVISKFETSNARGALLATADYVMGEIHFPENHGEEIVPIARKMLSQTEVSERWLDRSKSNFEAEVEAALAQSNTQMWNAARVAVLGNSPIAQFLNLDEVANIKRIVPADITVWHKDTLNQSNVTIAVTGAISSEDALAFVDALLADLPAGAPRERAKVKADFSGRNILLHLPEASKTAIGFLARLPNTRESNEFEDLLAAHLLNQPDGPLFRAVRTDLGAAYGATAGIANYSRDLRVFYIFAEVEPAKLAEARKALLDAFEEFRTKPDLTALDDMKSSMANSFNQTSSAIDASSRIILELALDGKDVSLAPKLASLLDGVTEDSLAQHFSTVFPPADQLVTLAVSARADALPGACVIQRFDEASRCK